MRRFNRNPLPVLGVLVIAMLAMTSCEKGGLVGSSFVKVDPNVSIDTLAVGAITIENLVSYSGGKSFIAAGRYEDPLFGTFEAVGMLTPRLHFPGAILTDTTRFGLVIRPTLSYGDTTSTVQYELREISQRWRVTDWKPDSTPVIGALLNTFEIGSEDSVYVQLPQEWANRYRDIYDLSEGNRDTTYVEEMFGFALVPVNGNKLSYINSTISYLLIDNLESGDVSVILRQRASSYSQITPPTIPTPANNVVIMNDFTQTGRISFTISEEVIGSRVLARVELVLYEDSELLESSLPANNARNSNNFISLFEIEEDEKQFFITKDPLLNATRNTRDGSYRVNLTSYTNAVLNSGESTEVVLYILSDTDNGIIRPNMFVSGAHPTRSPKIIITKVNPD